MEDSLNEKELKELDALDAFGPEADKVKYSIWLLGYDEDDNATDYEYLIDDDYDYEEEARKCYDYGIEHFEEMEANGLFKIPAGTAHASIFLERVYLKDGEEVQTEIVDSAPVK